MVLDELSDRELFSLIDQGRSDAFSALLTRHYDTLFAFSFKYCRRQQDAEDILQESLLKISRNFHRFDRRSLFTTWAYRIIINSAKDLFKKERNDRLKHQTYAAESLIHAGGPDEPVSDSIWGLINRLPAKLHDAVLLVYGEGLSHAEAATTLNCAETTVSWRLHQARKKLASEVRKLGLILLLFLFGGKRWTR